MYAGLVGRLLRWVIEQLNQGRVSRVVWLFSADAVFEFPGESSWSGTRKGRHEIGRWLQRFADTGLALEVVDVVVSGGPWDMRVATRFRDRLVDGDGSVVYENEGVLYDRIRWGRITRHESHEDTERVARFDEYLRSQGFST